MAGCKNYEEKIEQRLNLIGETRDIFSEEILKLRNGLNKVLDNIFARYSNEVEANAEKTDSLIGDRLGEVKKYIGALKEMEAYLERTNQIKAQLNMDLTNGQF
jgi:hypothetical protein